MTASPTDAVPGDVGLPSEETIAQTLCVEDGYDPDEAVAGNQSTGFYDFGPRWQANERSENTIGGRNYVRDARAILSLICPAFEAKEREIERLTNRLAQRTAEREAALDLAEEARLSAESKHAQAVEALARAKDEIVRTADDLSMHSRAVKLVEEIAAIIGQPALNSRAIVREAASAAARGETE